MSVHFMNQLYKGLLYIPGENFKNVFLDFSIITDNLVFLPL